MRSETTPTLPGYRRWVYTIMDVPEIVLPDNSPYIELSYEMSHEIVHLWLDIASPLLYTQAVYNLGGDFLVNIAQDNSNLKSPDNTYWTDLRQQMQINNFVPGLINATNDEDTSAALLTPLGLQNLTLLDLQTLKTPWGRVYMGIAQSIGSMWGLS
ncbi:MAG TPA: hypothetical protein VNZ45_10345 [Bacteroidia bacterium]|nr:hypothetical protein [Bacteroidia bacterium]